MCACIAYLEEHRCALVLNAKKPRLGASRGGAFIRSTHSSGKFLVTIELRLVRTFLLQAEVARLLLTEFSKFNTELLEVQTGNLLVEDLWKNVHSNRVLSLLREELDLSKRLVRERCRHHEAWVSSCTSKVNEASASKDYDRSSILEYELINLRLDVHLSRVLLKPSDIDLVIEVANVAHDSLVLH
jgi:hypothetical protein